VTFTDNDRIYTNEMTSAVMLAEHTMGGVYDSGRCECKPWEVASLYFVL